MEEEMVSMISNAGMATEGPDSYSSSNPVRPNKRTKNENRNSMKYKGVVSQQNGHWGAQIYTSQQRIWLGTFKTEKAAAMAYDSASLKLRPHDLHRNIPWTSITIQEPLFQGLYSSEAVLNMIKDGSYESKFTEFVRTQSLEATNDINFEMRNAPVGRGGILYQQLFQKELTPSDVGKLNRLVIPKKHALTFFPQIPGAWNKGDQRGNIIDDFQLIFYDNQLRSWKFRYCYWKSSQSYVFTKGWNRFVKEKELKAKDVVTFYRCEYKEEFCDERAFCMIDVKHDGGGKDEERNAVVEKDELDLDLGYWFECGSHGEVKKRATEEKVVGNTSIRLFGVQING